MPEEFCWDCFWWCRNSIILVKGINSCSKVQSIISWTKNTFWCWIENFSLSWHIMQLCHLKIMQTLANQPESVWALNQNEFYYHEDGFKNRHIFQHFGSSSYLLGCFSSLTIFDCSLWKLISWIKSHNLTKPGQWSSTWPKEESS